MSLEAHDSSAQYETVPFSLNDYPLMKELFQSAFEIEIDLNTFLKKYDTENLGHGVIGFLAIHNATKQPAAFYGVFPVKVLINGREVLAAQSGDTMTHKDHRKKGLFVLLAKKTLEKCKEKGVELVFGQPNQYSFRGLVHSLGFSILDYVNVYDLMLRVKTIPLAKIFAKAGLFNFYIRAVRLILSKNIPDAIEEFRNRYPSALGKVNRNRSYIIYKSQRHHLFLKVNKAIVWINFSDVLWIGDFNDYNLVDEKTIKKLKQLARLLGYNTIRFNFNESLPQPSFLQHFRKTKQEASCFFYLNKEVEGTNLVLTAADFDTW
jgi:GNAT superfamily N-acetyltransferase